MRNHQVGPKITKIAITPQPVKGAKSTDKSAPKKQDPAPDKTGNVFVEISRDGEQLGLMMFQPEQFAQLQKVAAARYSGDVGAVIDAAIDETIHRFKEPFPCTEFEAAIQSTLALLDALGGKLLADNIETVNPRSPEYNSQTASTLIGYRGMIDRERAALKRIFDDTFTWLQAPEQRRAALAVSRSLPMPYMMSEGGSL